MICWLVPAEGYQTPSHCAGRMHHFLLWQTLQLEAEMRVIELKQWYMISVREAAERVHRDPETIRRWIRSGRLPSQRVGIRYIVDEHDLLAMVDAESLLLPP